MVYDELAVMQRRLTRVARNSPPVLEAFDEGDAGQTEVEGGLVWVVWVGSRTITFGSAAR